MSCTLLQGVGGEKLGELVSSYDDGEQLTVSYAAREIQSCVYPTVLCLLRMSFCFDERTFPGLNEFGALGILD